MRKQLMTKRNCRLTLERLEDRTLPAMWGMAWPNPQHITVSFVPDGTAVGSPIVLTNGSATLTTS